MERAMGAKSKDISIRYRRVLYIVLAMLLCAALLIRFRYYKRSGRKPVEVYDLTWLDKSDKDNIMYRRWRYFIESKTNLPRRIEKYSKADANENYTLEETLVIGYPTDDEIRQVIEDEGF